MSTCYCRFQYVCGASWSNKMPLEGLIKLSDSESELQSVHPLRKMWWAKMDDLIFNSCNKWVFPSSLNPRGAWSANCNPVVFLWYCPPCGAVTPLAVQLVCCQSLASPKDANFETKTIQRHFPDHLRTSLTNTDRDNCILLLQNPLELQHLLFPLSEVDYL